MDKSWLHVGAFLDMISNLIIHRIAGNFGGVLNLAVWQTSWATAKLKSTKFFTCIYTYGDLYQTANLNLPIWLRWQFGDPTAKFNSTNISGYLLSFDIQFWTVQHPTSIHKYRLCMCITSLMQFNHICWYIVASPQIRVQRRRLRESIVWVSGRQSCPPLNRQFLDLMPYGILMATIS